MNEEMISTLWVHGTNTGMMFVHTKNSLMIFTSLGWYVKKSVAILHEWNHKYPVFYLLPTEYKLSKLSLQQPACSECEYASLPQGEPISVPVTVALNFLNDLELHIPAIDERAKSNISPV